MRGRRGFIFSSLSKTTNTLQEYFISWGKINTTIITKKKWTRERINLEHKPVLDIFFLF